MADEILPPSDSVDNRLPEKSTSSSPPPSSSLPQQEQEPEQPPQRRERDSRERRDDRRSSLSPPPPCRDRRHSHPLRRSPPHKRCRRDDNGYDARRGSPRGGYGPPDRRGASSCGPATADKGDPAGDHSRSSTSPLAFPDFPMEPADSQQFIMVDGLQSIWNAIAGLSRGPAIADIDDPVTDPAGDHSRASCPLAFPDVPEVPMEPAVFQQFMVDGFQSIWKGIAGLSRGPAAADKDDPVTDPAGDHSRPSSSTSPLAFPDVPELPMDLVVFQQFIFASLKSIFAGLSRCGCVRPIRRCGTPSPLPRTGSDDD